MIYVYNKPKNCGKHQQTSINHREACGSMFFYVVLSSLSRFEFHLWGRDPHFVPKSQSS